MGLGTEDSGYAKTGSTHYPTATGIVSTARPPHGLPLQGFQASGSNVPETVCHTVCHPASHAEG